jgi:hypothetical protein
MSYRRAVCFYASVVDTAASENAAELVARFLKATAEKYVTS